MNGLRTRLGELAELVKYHSDLYYNKAAPEVTDAEFDVMVSELKDLVEQAKTEDSQAEQIAVAEEALACGRGGEEEMSGKALELWPGAKPCVRCGHCCKVTSCGFGEWDEQRHRCAELIDKRDGTYECGKYEEIVGGPGRLWELAPAFGAGCCSSFNTDRFALLRRV